IHLQRFDNSNKPLSTMEIMSLGDIISGLLANPITRQDLEYRHNYGNREEDELSGKIADVFDGEIYKALKDRQMFRNTYDQCIAIYNDGFVTDKRGSKLFTIVHVILLNQSPNKRSKVYCFIFGGDALGVYYWNLAAYYSSMLGFRFCYCRGIHPDNQSLGMYFVDSDAELRTLEDYVEADPNKGYHGRSLITQLSTFARPTSYVYNDINGLARGVSSELFEMFTVDLLSSNNKIYYTYPNGEFEVENYPFFISKSKLKEIGEGVEKTRQYISAAFDGSFQNIIFNIRGTRAVDYLDFALIPKQRRQL
ncbi:hypothetical protein INT46_011479, partial [Mucor plumbeus]